MSGHGLLRRASSQSGDSGHRPWLKSRACIASGECFAAPSIYDENGDARPHMEVRSRHGVVFSRLTNGDVRSLQAYTAQGGYTVLEEALAKPSEKIIEAIEISGLRGRGGAGFPTGRKWRAVAQHPAGEKFIVANADEGDPGAYIDRFLLEDDPHALLEGMLLAAYAVGARKGWIYLRNEYPRAEEILRNAIAEARSAGLLGKRVLGRDFVFDVDLVVGRGSYVCGEETALIRSIEGRRPHVMARPPYPTEHGLFGKPTLVNNVETLVSVPWIVARGGEAYRALGFSQSRGTKVVSLNSLFVSARSLRDRVRHDRATDRGRAWAAACAIATIRGVIIGGPLAGVIPPHLFDTPFGFEELHAIGASVGHGGIVAFDRAHFHSGAGASRLLVRRLRVVR